jgi:hypothetical protein
MTVGVQQLVGSERRGRFASWYPVAIAPGTDSNYHRAARSTVTFARIAVTEPRAVASGSKRCPVETTQPLISPAKAGAGFKGALIPGLRSLRSLTPG